MPFVAGVGFSLRHLLAELSDEAFHFLFFGQLDGIAGNEDFVAQITEGELDEDVIFAGAEEDADGRLVARGHLVFFVVGDVGVELAQVLVAKGIGLEFHQDVALEDAVVEDEIDEEMFVADEDALLPRLEAEAVAQLEEEILKTIQQGIFEVGLGHDIPGTQAEELEDVGIADDVGWLERVRGSVGHGGQLVFVFGEAAALIVEAGDLAAQLADGPVSADVCRLGGVRLGFRGSLTCGNTKALSW